MDTQDTKMWLKGLIEEINHPIISLHLIGCGVVRAIIGNKPGKAPPVLLPNIIVDESGREMSNLFGFLKRYLPVRIISGTNVTDLDIAVREDIIPLKLIRADLVRERVQSEILNRPYLNVVSAIKNAPLSALWVISALPTYQDQNVEMCGIRLALKAGSPHLDSTPASVNEQENLRGFSESIRDKFLKNYWISSTPDTNPKFVGQLYKFHLVLSALMDCDYGTSIQMKVEDQMRHDEHAWWTRLYEGNDDLALLRSVNNFRTLFKNEPDRKGQTDLRKLTDHIASSLPQYSQYLPNHVSGHLRRLGVAPERSHPVWTRLLDGRIVGRHQRPMLRIDWPKLIAQLEGEV